MSGADPPADPKRYERELKKEVEGQIGFLEAACPTKFSDVRLEGSYPDTEIVLEFLFGPPRGVAGRRYGWRYPVWPPHADTVDDEAFITIAIQLMEELSLGPIPDDAAPGEIQWI